MMSMLSVTTAGLDALSGFSMEDPKTVAGVGKKPKGGYTSKLDKEALRDKRIGLYGPGWRTLPLSEETAKLYERAQDEMKNLGALQQRRPVQSRDCCETVGRSGHARVRIHLRARHKTSQGTGTEKNLITLRFLTSGVGARGLFASRRI